MKFLVCSVVFWKSKSLSTEVETKGMRSWYLCARTTLDALCRRGADRRLGKCGMIACWVEPLIQMILGLPDRRGLKLHPTLMFHPHPHLVVRNKNI